MDTKDLAARPRLEQYKKQAKDFIAAFRSGDPDTMRWIRRCHPSLPGRADTNDRNEVTEAEIRRVKLRVADAQFIVARQHQFENWRKFTKHIEALNQKDSPVARFEAAVDAIIVGDIATLERLLRQNPELIRARSTREHRATLLHYVGANAVEAYHQKTPKNAVKIAEVLLKAGAEVDADLDYGPRRRRYPERTGSSTLGICLLALRRPRRVDRRIPTGHSLSTWRPRRLRGPDFAGLLWHRGLLPDCFVPR